MEKTKIEWCDSTINPISGCYNTCEYCYARSIATRFAGCDEYPDGKAPLHTMVLFEPLYRTNEDGKKRPAAYPFGFTPTYHKYRLERLKKGGYGKTIFVCSMADMFADWIPDSWIADIFKTCLEVPGHRYLFLTKNPERYRQLYIRGLLPEANNFWYGTTSTNNDMPIFYSDRHNTFVSVEPILEKIDSAAEVADLVDWVIIGAETGNRKDKVVPERSWVEKIVDEFRDREKPVFMKDSMIPIWGEDIPVEYPWDD